MRVLALDLGSRRVGVAVSDSTGMLATPLTTIVRMGNRRAEHRAVAELVAAEEAVRLIVGLPLNMDGSSGPAARDTILWAKKLATRTKTDLIFVDERLSSFTAEQKLTARKRAGEKLTHKKKKQQQDAVAAAGFLQEFLDGKLPAHQF